MTNIFSLSGDMKLPQRIEEAMQMQVEAERKKRASILESEGGIMKMNITAFGMLFIFLLIIISVRYDPKILLH